MLLGQAFPAVLGATAPALNLGHLRTKGWEASLGWADHAGAFGYRISGSITDNNNKLIDTRPIQSSARDTMARFRAIPSVHISGWNTQDVYRIRKRWMPRGCWHRVTM